MKQVKDLLIAFFNFLRAIVQRRFLIMEMAKRDIATQHVGSMLGFFWSFINPMVQIFIFWFIFAVKFHSAPKGNVPFVVWLTAAMAIWNTFAEIINGSTNSIIGNRHLVKKIVFPLSILPVVKLVGSFITHSIFLLMLFVLILLHKMPFSIYWAQALYYFFAMSILALGFSWITSSVNVFARDTGQIVNVVLQFVFWFTPVFWDTETLAPNIQFFFKLNPMYYIVQGYRESFIYFVPFWHHWQMTLYFWGVTFFIFSVGATIYFRLRPHFADVL